MTLQQQLIRIPRLLEYATSSAQSCADERGLARRTLEGASSSVLHDANFDITTGKSVGPITPACRPVVAE
jgi:hypothetical protein